MKREIIVFQNKEKYKNFYFKNSKVIDELNKAQLIFKKDKNNKIILNNI